DLQLAEGQAAAVGLVVPAPQPGQKPQPQSVTWKVQVQKAGKYSVKVKSSTGVTQTKTITIEDATKLTVVVDQADKTKREFLVTAKVTNPVKNQTLQLELKTLEDKGKLQVVEGQEKVPVPVPPPPPGAKESSVRWRLRADDVSSSYRVAVQSSTGVTL